MAANNKMRWFIDAYNNNTLPHHIANGNRNIGVVCMPTGTGKSGVVYDHAIYKVMQAINNNQKIIINICCPILKLCQQFINDFMSIIYELNKHDLHKISVFLNSSDSVKKYINIDNPNNSVETISGLYSFENAFLNNSNKNVAIIASCVDSLVKYTNLITNIKKNSQYDNIKNITYIDECHLFYTRKINDDHEIIEKFLSPLVNNSDEIYGLTATPSKYVNDVLQCFERDYIYLLDPYDAISSNMILPPSIHFMKTETDCISVDALKSIINQAKSELPNIHHKVLVTCKSSSQLLELRKQLEDEGYKVFSSCAMYGFGIDDNEEPEEDNEFGGDVVKFIKAIDNYDGDCFVLHIKQLIQGIDIKSLTDCVIYTDREGSVDGYRHTIQIIGRTLRLLDKDRISTGKNKGKGKDINKRLKKFGGVYFITSTENDNIEKELQTLVSRYYGIFMSSLFHDAYERGKQKDGDNKKELEHKNRKDKQAEPFIWDYATNDYLKINVEQFINETLIPYIKDSLVYKENILKCEEYAKIFIEMYNIKYSDMNSLEFLTDNSLIKTVASAIKSTLLNLKFLGSTQLFNDLGADTIKITIKK